MAADRFNGAVLVAGLCLAAGLAAGGWLVGNGMARFRSDLRTVTVKGLVEREVSSDRAVWTLAFRRAGETVAEAHAAITADREAILAFLGEQGFGDAEIERHPTRSFDRRAQDFGGEGKSERLRYIVTSAVVISTADIARVRSSVGATESLLKAGVILDGGERANPRYQFSKFNEMRPQLLADATKNARTVAQQFADDSGTAVGRIQSANQGNIQIFGSDGNDESAPYSPTSTPVKKIRVVSTFQFALK